MTRIIRSEKYTYRDLTEAITLMCQKYPFLEKTVIGKSVSGKNIIALKLPGGDSSALFAAAFHGSEHITTNISLMLLEDMAYAYQNNSAVDGINIRKALSSRGVIFVPRVNPDGCDISILGAAAAGKRAGEITKQCGGDFNRWNANLRGVDINHNFNADFAGVKQREREAEIYVPGPTRFGGDRPESEPETAAMVSLCKNENLSLVCALHAQGEVIYWGYKDYCLKRNRQMAKILAATGSYALDVPTGIASGGGFKDWFCMTFNRPGFTVELGRGKNPLPIAQAREIYLKAREMLTVCAIL